VIIHTYNALEEFKKAFRDKQKQKWLTFQIQLTKTAWSN
jgi:hypothetical protein